MNSKYTAITPEQFKALMEFKTEGKLQMMNLMKFKKNVAETGMSGKEQYQKYMIEAFPFFKKSNARILFDGSPNVTLIGPTDDLEWDKILIVEYNSKQDFLEMVSSQGYPSKTRALALEDSRLILCTSNSNL